MMKHLILFTCLLGGAMAENLTVQQELYITAGILGGICLLLTIATIFNSVTIIGLQSKVKVLQAAGTATVKAVATAVENASPPPPPMNSKPTDPMGNTSQNPLLHRNRTQSPYQAPIYDDPESDNDRRDPYDSRSAPREDPYRRQESRGGYKMERQPSRGFQEDRRQPTAGYY